MDTGKQSKEARQQKTLIWNQGDRQWGEAISMNGSGLANTQLASLPMEKYDMMEMRSATTCPLCGVEDEDKMHVIMCLHSSAQKH